MPPNSSNDSHPFPPSSSFTVYDFTFECFQSTVGISYFTAYTIISILLLPLYVPVIYLLHRRWQRQRSSTSMTHSDLITYQVVALELVNIIVCILCCSGLYADVAVLIAVGVYFFSMKLSGQILFHILTCMEQYLAVVHPVTYLSLRTTNMIRIRNITFGGVWVLCSMSLFSMSITDEYFILIMTCTTSCFTVLVISFFSGSVLFALIQSKPGEGGGEKLRVHRTKLRAFYIIMTILGVLLLRSGSYFLTLFQSRSMHVGANTKCAIFLSVLWFCLPSSLVPPLMFLKQAGKLSCLWKSKRTAHVSE